MGKRPLRGLAPVLSRSTIFSPTAATNSDYGAKPLDFTKPMETIRIFKDL